MYTTDSSTAALAKADTELTPTDRLHELAAILAAGVLRLKTRPESLPPCQHVASATQRGGSAVQATTLEPANASPEGTAEKLSESRRNCLDEFARPRTHVPAV